MERTFRDLRHAARGLARRPGFTAVAVLTLGLGIGGNTAIFSVVSGLLLRPLPYATPGSLVEVNHYYPSLNGLEASVSAEGFRDYSADTHSFSGLAAEAGQSVNITGRGEPERVSAAAVTPTYFQTLGVPAELGRAFGSDVSKADAHVVVLRHGWWARHFGSDPGVLGTTLDLDGEPYTVVGVMPPGFRDPFGRSIQMWVPLVLTEAQYARGYTNEWLSVVGRLAPGVDLEAARSEMAAFAEQLKKDRPRQFAPDWSIRVTSLVERAHASVRPALLVLLGAVLVVLLIACANVANLLLTRASGQRRQTAVRLAMGARRVHILRHLLAQGVVLGLAGALVGLGLGWWGLAALKALASNSVPAVADVSLDHRVLVFTLLVSVGTGIFVGLVPVASVWGTDVLTALREGVRAGDDRRSLGLRRLFVISQLALSLALLAGAGLLLRSMARLQAVSPGFDPHGLMTFYLDLPAGSYPDPSAQRAFYERLVPAIASVPGVRSVGLESVLPFSGRWSTSSFTIEGYQPGPNEPRPWGDVRIVSPGFRKALGLPLLAGRFLTDEDGPDSPPVVVVDEELAHRYFPDGDAVGHRLSFGDGDVEIVGVVGHAAHEGLDANRRVQVYGSYRQFPDQHGMYILTRTSGDPNALVPGLREAVRSVDPQLPLADVATMQHRIADSMGERRMSLVLITVFALMALLLAATGVYGVMAEVVGQRTREMGVRMAMGASRGAVLSLVVRQGVSLASIGILLGLAGSLVISRFLKSQLFGVTPRDPATYAVVVGVLLASATLATLVPALRAVRVDPAHALRQE